MGGSSQESWGQGREDKPPPGALCSRCLPGLGYSALAPMCTHTLARTHTHTHTHTPPAEFEGPQLYVFGVEPEEREQVGTFFDSVRLMTSSVAGSPPGPCFEGGVSWASAVTRHQLEIACDGICPSVLVLPGTRPGIWPSVGQRSKAMAGLSDHGRQGRMATRGRSQGLRAWHTLS